MVACVARLAEYASQALLAEHGVELLVEHVGLALRCEVRFPLDVLESYGQRVEIQQQGSWGANAERGGKRQQSMLLVGSRNELCGRAGSLVAGAQPLTTAFAASVAAGSLRLPTAPCAKSSISCQSRAAGGRSRPK